MKDIKRKIGNNILILKYMQQKKANKSRE